jgi:hypothetical protein
MAMNSHVTRASFIGKLRHKKGFTDLTKRRGSDLLFPKKALLHSLYGYILVLTVLKELCGQETADKIQRQMFASLALHPGCQRHMHPRIWVRKGIRRYVISN